PNNGQIDALALQLDGTIFVGGAFSTFNGVTRTALAKLETSGSLNTAFTTVIGVPATVNDIVIQTDGRILIGGDFRGVNESFRDGVARLNADGSTD
ncbi:MAG TPA: delta-60 repeat domain-containing protein, partial [Pyrinomonadaceae bacterium]|nr:delta-60 repeat domain-containing protein [Pyrinomonadaceae bacterium]